MDPQYHDQADALKDALARIENLEKEKPLRTTRQQQILNDSLVRITELELEIKQFQTREDRTLNLLERVVEKLGHHSTVLKNLTEIQMTNGKQKS